MPAIALCVALTTVAYSPGTSLAPRLAIGTHLRIRAAPAFAAAPATTASDNDDKAWLYQGLSFFSGFADVFTYQQFNGFANKMTGNAIQTAASLAMRRWMDCAFYSSLLLSFAVGVAAYRIVDVKRKQRLTTSSAGALVAVLFASADFVLNRCHGTRWALLLVVAGSGLINAASSEETGAITSMVTGHLQKLANYGADVLALGTSPSAASKKAAQTSARVVVSFVGGVLAATLVPLRRLSSSVPIFSAISIPFAAMLLFNDRAAWQARRDDWMAIRQAETAATPESCVMDSYDAECQQPGEEVEGA